MSVVRTHLIGDSKEGTEIQIAKGQAASVSVGPVPKGVIKLLHDGFLADRVALGD